MVLHSLEGASTTMGSALNTALTTSVTPSGIITEFTSILPWIGVMIGAAFVIYEARKLIKGAAKGKVRV